MPQTGNPEIGRHLLWYHGAHFSIFRNSHFVVAIYEILCAKFGDPSLNEFGAMALGVKKIMADFAGLGRWRPLSKFWFAPLNSPIFSIQNAKTQLV